MARTLKTSMDWQMIHLELFLPARKLPQRKDAIKMLDNIAFLVRKLSVAEIEAKRQKVESTRTTKELVEEINKQIEEYEGQVFFAILCKE